MSLKAIIKDQNGFTYTLEAILGIFLIMGTVVYVTTNMPYTAQKTGEHSKVQLMNIGRDTLDLTLITPVNETCPWPCGMPKVDRNYTLVADNYSVMPGENVTFSVYYVDTGKLVDIPLTLKETVLGRGDTIGNKTIIGSTNWSFSSTDAGEYDFVAVDANGYPSNHVTIRVGFYFLYMNLDGVVINQLVTGEVNNSDGVGVDGLTIRIWGYAGNNLTIVNSSATTTTGGGNFSFVWTSNTVSTGTGTYYIQAIDSTGNTSNKHRIVYVKNPWGTLYASNYIIYETQSTKLILNPSGNQNLDPLNHMNINLISYNCNNVFDYTNINLAFDPNDPSHETAIMTVNRSGDYYIFYGGTGSQCSNSNDNANDAKTNTILIHVLPWPPNTGLTEDNCVNATKLNQYMRRYMPPYVNYNLYLISPNGSRFAGCPDFFDPVIGKPDGLGELINGYPTAEAMAVSKLAHIKYMPTEVDNIVEYRIVLWYK